MNEVIEIDKVELEVVVKMLKMTYSFELWDKLLDLSDSLHKRVNKIFKENKQNDSYGSQSDKPLVYYYGYSLLMKGLAYKELERYTESLSCIEAYSDLSWFRNLDEKGQQEVRYYTFISEPNRLEVHLLSGKIEVLDAYVEFLTKNPTEILPGLISIVKAANKFTINIDKILIVFSNELNELLVGEVNGMIDNAYVQTFLMGIIRYQITLHHYDLAVEYALKLLTITDKADNDKFYKQAIVFFESIREYASDEQVHKFNLHISNINERVEIQ